MGWMPLWSRPRHASKSSRALRSPTYVAHTYRIAYVCIDMGTGARESGVGSHNKPRTCCLSAASLSGRSSAMVLTPRLSSSCCASLYPTPVMTRTDLCSGHGTIKPPAHAAYMPQNYVFMCQKQSWTGAREQEPASDSGPRNVCTSARGMEVWSSGLCLHSVHTETVTVHWIEEFHIC